MKKIFIFIVIIFSSYQYASSWEGIGVNVGGGYYNYFLMGIPPWIKEDGFGTIIAVEIPIVESNILEIEGALINYWRKEKQSDTYKSVRYSTTSYGIRVYFFDYNSTIRPSVHLGASTLPLISWSGGIACDYKIYKNAHLQLSSWFILDGLVQLAGYDNPPAFLMVSFKYYLKE